MPGKPNQPIFSTICRSKKAGSVSPSPIVKGTSNGVVTDIDGNYSLNATGGGTLVFSYVGYVTQERPWQQVP